jgi:hypothetical protein
LMPCQRSVKFSNVKWPFSSGIWKYNIALCVYL